MVDRIIFPPPGKYVVAVSGGVDSMSLLDLLAKQRDLELVVAHYDHQWRPDSHLDGELILSFTTIAGLPLYIAKSESQRGSEAAARQERYDFLHAVAATVAAGGIITAHHADDQLETSLLNVARGTARRGRAPSLERPGFFRPLQIVGKPELLVYAQTHNLPWREDSTNQDTQIPRNFIRQELGVATDYGRLMQSSAGLSEQIEAELNKLIATIGRPIPGGIELDRAKLQGMSAAVTAELIAAVVRKIEPGLQLTKKQITELALSAKTGRTGLKRDVAGRLSLEVGRDTVAVALPRGKGPRLE